MVEDAWSARIVADDALYRQQLEAPLEEAVWDWEKSFALDDAFYEEQLEKRTLHPPQCQPPTPAHLRWVQHMTPKTSRGQWLFYHNATMGWCTWQQPSEPYRVAWKRRSAHSEVPLPEWEEHAFYANWCQRWLCFYYNTKSGVSTWQRPSEPYIPCFESIRSPFPTRWRPAY